MRIINQIPVLLLSIFLYACTDSNSSEHPEVAAQSTDQPALTEQKNHAGTIPTRYPVLAEGNQPESKFTVQNTHINSFEASNTYNGYGFAYIYQQRSGEGEAHYYKLIQEFQEVGFNSSFPDRKILAEHWFEITENEWLETQASYQETSKITDLYPQAFANSSLYQKRLAFLNRS